MTPMIQSLTILGMEVVGVDVQTRVTEMLRDHQYNASIIREGCVVIDLMPRHQAQEMQAMA